MRVVNLDMVDEAKCSSNILESNSCTEHLESEFSNTSSPLRPDANFLETRTAKSYYENSNWTISSQDYYKCHLGAVKAVEDCKLNEIEQEMVCIHAKKDQCLGLAYSSGATVEEIDAVEDQNKKCHMEINGVKSKPGEYGECVLKSFKENRMGANAYWKQTGTPVPYWAAHPFQGINCLHEYIEMPPCAKDKKPGLKPLGDQWHYDPCKYSTKRKRWGGWKKGRKAFYTEEACRAFPSNTYYSEKLPYQSHFSLTMYDQIANFATSIKDNLECNICSEGNLCVMDDAEQEEEGARREREEGSEEGG